MGPPDRVTGFPRRTRPEQDTLVDNGLAVLEYISPEHDLAVQRTLLAACQLPLG
jgi:hypothetical protein